MSGKVNRYPGCDICELVPKIAPEFVILDSTYWLANLRDNDQTLLGTTFVALKQHVSELDYLTPAQDHEFLLVRNAVQSAIRKSFDVLTFNTSCLKNEAFKSASDTTPPEAAHVHWHIKPRYRKGQVIEFAGETFQDPLPGRYLSTFERHRPKRETAIKIAETIRGNIG